MKNRVGPRKREAGFSLLQVIMASGMLGMVAYFGSSLLSGQMKGSQQMRLVTEAENIRRSVMSLVGNETAWKNTVLANPSLACLKPLFDAPAGPASCANDYVSAGLVVKDGGPAGGKTAYDTSGAANGLTAQSQPCTAFSPTGNDKCPLRLEVKARVVCSTNCAQPQIRIEGGLQYRPSPGGSQKFAFNENNYTLGFFRGESAAVGNLRRYEGGQNVGGSSCPGNYAGGFCDASFTKQITFLTPFENVPMVMVSMRAESIHTYCPCCTGASDQAYAYPENITTTGFTVRTAISPFGVSCGPTYSNWVVQSNFDWVAIGQ